MSKGSVFRSHRLHPVTLLLLLLLQWSTSTASVILHARWSYGATGDDSQNNLLLFQSEMKAFIKSKEKNDTAQMNDAFSSVEASFHHHLNH